MNVLISAEYFYPFVGGAEICLYSLARKLAKKHNVYVYCTGNADKKFVRESIHINQISTPYRFIKARWMQLFFSSKKWLKIVSDAVSDTNPDIILTQLNLSPPTIEIANRLGIPSALFLHSFDSFCPTNLYLGERCKKDCLLCMPNIKWILQYYFIKKYLLAQETAMNNAELVISNSQYMQKFFRDKCDISTEIIYPFIELNDFKADDSVEKKYITFINPLHIKGLEIFKKIVLGMPNKLFLVVNGFKSKMEEKKLKAKNIKYMQATNDMRKVYSMTKILLVPSICHEAFPRVCIEAMINGIPSIISNRGGLPENVGNSGIVIKNIYDIEEWCSQINRLDNEVELYKTLSERSRNRALKFDFEKTYELFKQAAKKKLAITL